TCIANGAGATAQATVSMACTPTDAYSCSGNNIVRTSTSTLCAVTVTNPYAVCVLPAYCSPGSQVCLYPPPAVVADNPNNLSGHLQARPTIIAEDKTVKLYWNISNVSSCTV